ncbi:MAG TPA: polysaccharide lyase family 1 protein [Acidimicrobiales bacterium]|nr:polysaccharide lyase family 1 protein [Acidimicrobiales bacterium]
MTGRAVRAGLLAVALWAALVTPLHAQDAQVPALGRPEGFAAQATGGARGKEYVVRNVGDSGPGSLREGAESGEPLRIRFAVSGEIRLATPLRVGRDKTIDGRGASVRLTGRGVLLEQPNVILENLLFGPFDRRQRQDAVAIHRGARNVWIDHCNFTGAPDKAVEIIGGGTDVTVSWNRFSDQEQVIQAGAFETGEADRDIRLTVHHNFFDGTGYRNPRISYGKAHVFNNVLRAWKEHGMSVRRDGELASEANVFEAGPDNSAIELSGGKDDKDESPGFARSTGDLLLGGADAKTREPERVFDPAQFYRAPIEPADAALVDRVVAGAGWREYAPLAPQVTAPPQTSPSDDGAPRDERATPTTTTTGEGGDSGNELVAAAAGAGVALLVVLAVVLVRRRRTVPTP